MNPILIRERHILRSLLFSLFLLIQVLSCFAQGTIYVSGTYTGKSTWSADTVKVTGNLTVDTLFIESGTIVEFQGNYLLTINRYLMANGEVGDTILFTIHDTTGFSDPNTNEGGWGGLYIQYIDIGENLLKYCKLQYVKDLNDSPSPHRHGAISGDLTKVDILNSCITNNYTNGIDFCGSELYIYKCVISNNKGKGVICESGQIKTEESIVRNNSGTGIRFSEGLRIIVERSVIELNESGINGNELRYYCIKGNTIQNNRITGVSLNCTYETGVIENNIIRFNKGTGLELGFGIAITDYVTNNNLIYNNNGYGIEADYGQGLLTNNTIMNNSDGGVSANYIYKQNIVNCIIRNNGGKQISFKVSNVNVYHSNIEGFTADNIDGEFINNMDLDPMFEDTANFDFHLSDYSPCINAGMSDTTGLSLPSTDMDGNTRIFDGRIDLGAYEYQQDNFHILKQPIDQTVCEGETTYIEADAIGGIIGYQWQKNGVDIPSASQRILTFNPANINDDGYYNCVIIVDDRIVSTDTVRLIVDYNFELNWQTASFIICPGKDTLLSVNTTKIDNLDFQWYKNNQIIANEVSSTLEIISPETAVHEVYYCTVSNNCKSLESENIDFYTYSRPNPPDVNNIDVCEETPIPDFFAIGENIKWYSDQDLEHLVFSGNTYNTNIIQPGVYNYYVTQSPLDCESNAATSTITIKNKPEITMAESYTTCKNVAIRISAGSGFKSYNWSTGDTSESITVIQSGSFEVTVTAQNECTTTKSTDILIHELPEIELDGPYSLCKGIELTLDAGIESNGFLWNTGATTKSISVSESGVYTVSVTDSNGCSNSDFAVVIINDLPQLQLPNDTTISTNDILRIDAGNGYQSYSWNTGSENQILTLTGLTPGIYKYSVRVSDQNNCYAEDTIKVTVVTINNIHEKVADLGFKIYPNPGSDILYLKTSNSFNAEVKIAIVDNTGKTLLIKKFKNLLNTLIYQIDVSDLSKGVYYFQISNKQMIDVEKIVLK